MSLAEELDPAAGGDEAADGVHDRGLAGTVGADEADDLVAVDVEVDPVDDPPLAEGDAEAPHGEVGSVGGRSVDVDRVPHGWRRGREPDRGGTGVGRRQPPVDRHERSHPGRRRRPAPGRRGST